MKKIYPVPRLRWAGLRVRNATSIARSGDGVTFIDDYGHHPTEIAAVLSAARQLKPSRVVVLFQPHRFSR